jgi:hypothetical protein
MKEPKRIKLNPETPVSKEITKYRLEPSSGQDNDDIYTPIDLRKINETLDNAANEDFENSN